MTQDALWKLPATELGAMMDRKALSAVELLEVFLARCDVLNPGINAIVTFDREGAREQARASEQRMQAGKRLSVLDGIPVTIKDNLFVKGLPASWGSRLFASFQAPEDDLVVAHLRGAGAVIVGKTNTPELALASHTDNLVFGKTRNPWDLALTPGGSSGGAVAAVAAGLTPLAIGTDAGGSIRRPAGYTGIVGIRPSTGRIPRRFGFPSLAHDFQVIGPAARTVDDVYALFRTVARPDARDRASLAFGTMPLPETLGLIKPSRLRIRYVPSIGSEPIDAEIKTNVSRAAECLESLGHDVVEGPAPFDMRQVDAIRGTLSAAGVARVVSGHKMWREEVGAAIAAITEAGLAFTAIDYVRALDALQALRLSVAAEFEKFDLLLTATSTAMPWPVELPYPPRIDGREAGPRASGLFATFVNATGLPAISVPVEPSAHGLPIGMQLVGPFGADIRVLEVAKEFESAHPWSARWPAFAVTH